MVFNPAPVISLFDHDSGQPLMLFQKYFSDLSKT
jgi:hypothetical protein